MYKAIIFDLDDTLISELEYIKSGYRHISNVIANEYSLNANSIYDLLFYEFKENKIEVFNRTLEKLNIFYSMDYINKLVKEYREHSPKISFFDDVYPTINMIKQDGLKLGIITDGYKEAQRQKLEALNAFEVFDEIIITDDFGRDFWKPSPKPFELMKERLGVNFNDMIYIGDNPEKDFYIGSIYPITTVRIIRGDGVYINREYFKDVKNTFTINSLMELNLSIRL